MCSRRREHLKLLILYLAITVAGYFAGSALRKKKWKIWWAGNVQAIAIMILVGLMGMRLGANSDVIGNIPSFGITALVLTLFAIAGSLAAVLIARKLMKIDRRGVKTDD